MESRGKRLLTLRLEQGLSGRAQAKTLGASGPTPGRWEEGAAQPHDPHRHQIAREKKRRWP